MGRKDVLVKDKGEWYLHRFRSFRSTQCVCNSPGPNAISTLAYLPSLVSFYLWLHNSFIAGMERLTDSMGCLFSLGLTYKRTRGGKGGHTARAAATYLWWETVVSSGGSSCFHFGRVVCLFLDLTYANGSYYPS